MKGTPQAQIETLLSQLLDAGWNPNDIRCTFESALNRCSACEELERERSKGNMNVVEEQQREHEVGTENNDEHHAPNAQSEDTTQPLHDLIVVGAGPHALALVSRLLEERPAALYTDLEHARISWLRTYAKPSRDPRGFSRTLVRLHNRTARPDIVVLDRHARPGWMPHWRTMFEKLEIRTLRSPMFFHPGPADVDGMLAYACRTGRESELTPIPGVVGKELSKYAKKKLAKEGKRPRHLDTINERDRHDYQTPGTKLFFDFCSDDIQDHYGLSNMVTPGEVTGVSYDRPDASVVVAEGNGGVPDKIFTVTLKDGRRLASRAVVLAIGNNTIPHAPDYLLDQPGTSWEGGLHGRAWCHTSCFAQPSFVFPPRELQAKIDAGENTSVVVIGGGLTSAQIVDVAQRRGVRRLVLICRSHLKMKPFDFDTTWVDKYQNVNKMRFWREDDREERRQMVLQARNGGSVNYPYYKLLRDLEARGALELRTCTTVSAATYDATHGWTLTLSPSPSSTSKTTPTTTTTLTNIDFIVSATGSAPALDATPWLQALRAQVPVATCGGLPVLTPDLQWAPDVPLFVAGGLAALELGPTGQNLGGAREGAERIANRLGRLWDGLRRGSDADAGVETEEGEEEDEKLSAARWRAEEAERRAGNHGGFFDVLSDIACSA